MQKEYSKDIVKSLKAFMAYYEPANASNVKYFMSTLAVHARIMEECPGASFTVQDAYNFMLKAGYIFERLGDDPTKATWLLKRASR
ncbi:MAG: hypothetical protein JST26_04815 [Bacteroidetes bacterium]|nr:hypothetical protein [Bacteroidota bacterium]